MKNNSSESLRRVLRHLKPYTGWIILALLCAAGNVAAALYIPILVGKAVDAIVGPGQVAFAAVASIGLEIAVLALLGAAAQWVMNVVNNRIVFCVTRDTRAEAFTHLQKLPLSYLDSHPSGDVISRMIADVDQFADGLLMGFTQLFTGVLTILGTLGIMFYLNWKITLVVVVLTPLSLFAAKFIASRTYNMFREQSQSRGEQTAFLNEMVDGQKVVQAFGYEPRAEARFGALNEALRRASLRATFFSSLTNPVTRFVTSVVYACVGLAGAMSAVAGAITVGGLTVFLSYANQYAKPFNEISGVVTELQNAVACAGRVFAHGRAGADPRRTGCGNAHGRDGPRRAGACGVPLRAADAAARGCEPRCPPGRARRHRRPDGLRQDDAHQSAHALLRRERRRDHRRRTRRPQRHARQPPAKLRYGLAGHLAQDRHGAREHRAGPARGHGG